MKRWIAFVLCFLLAAGSLSAVFAEESSREVSLSLDSATDEELAEAAEKIQAEQKSRLTATVTVDPSEVTVTKGTAKWLTYTAENLPEGVRVRKAVWASSDSEIATCDQDGKVLAVAPGEVTVTCTVTLTDDTELAGECVVTSFIPVKSLSFEKNTMSVMVDDVFVPEAVISPENVSNPTLKWSSDDETVVKVNESGEDLTAMAVGSAKVTAETTDGSEKKATITVTVTRKIGKTDEEVTFFDVPWESDVSTALKTLEEKGAIAADTSEMLFPASYAPHWPSDDVLFSSAKWYEVPSVFTDKGEGTYGDDVSLQESVCDTKPASTSLVFLSSLQDDGTVDEDSGNAKLIGVSVEFSETGESGGKLFNSLLSQMEARYGEFSRYIHSDFVKYKKFYSEVYDTIADQMADAETFDASSVSGTDEDLYLSMIALATLKGNNDTGIMLQVSSSGRVILFFGKTDAFTQIQAVEEALNAQE